MGLPTAGDRRDPCRAPAARRSGRVAGGVPRAGAPRTGGGIPALACNAQRAWTRALDRQGGHGLGGGEGRSSSTTVLVHLEEEQRRRDAQRLNQLQAAGWRVIVLTADDLRRPEATIALVKAALAERRHLASDCRSVQVVGHRRESAAQRLHTQRRGDYLRSWTGLNVRIFALVTGLHVPSSEQTWLKPLRLEGGATDLGVHDPEDLAVLGEPAGDVVAAGRRAPVEGGSDDPVLQGRVGLRRRAPGVHLDADEIVLRAPGVPVHPADAQAQRVEVGARGPVGGAPVDDVLVGVLGARVRPGRSCSRCPRSAGPARPRRRGPTGTSGPVRHGPPACPSEAG